MDKMNNLQPNFSNTVVVYVVSISLLLRSYVDRLEDVYRFVRYCSYSLIIIRTILILKYPSHFLVSAYDLELALLLLLSSQFSQLFFYAIIKSLCSHDIDFTILQRLRLKDLSVACGRDAFVDAIQTLFGN